MGVVVYGVHDRKLYIGTSQKAWKVRHVAANPHVSVTIPIAKRIPIMPWIKIPAATITLPAPHVIAGEEASPELMQAMFRQQAYDPEFVADMCLIEVTPVGEFVTYGIGVSLMQMRYRRSRADALRSASTQCRRPKAAEPAAGDNQ